VKSTFDEQHTNEIGVLNMKTPLASVVAASVYLIEFD
jgi:hypothetical protein